MVGGTGALGRKVVSELLNGDRRVRMLVRDPVKAEEFARRGVELVHGDMMDLPSLIAAIDGADSVITCACGRCTCPGKPRSDLQRRASGLSWSPYGCLLPPVVAALSVAERESFSQITRIHARAVEPRRQTA